MRFLAFFFIAIFITSPSYAEGDLLNIKEITGASGVKAWLVEDHSVPVIAMKFSFKGMGAAQDPSEKQGLARMLSNTMDEGAGDLDSQHFQKELRDLVIDLRFNSNRDDFGGSLKTLTKHKDRAFELLNLALTKPRFDEEAIERMRNGNMSRIRSALSDPGWIAARIMNDVAFAGHPYAQNSGGTLETLKNINTDDLRALSKKLARNQLHVAVAGDITAEELSSALDNIFSELPEKHEPKKPPALTLKNQNRIFVHEMDIPQSIVEITQEAIDRQDPDYHGAQIMNFVLGSSGFGSRLTKEIREKRGLTYGIYSYISDMDALDTLSVSTSTKNEAVADMRGLIAEEFIRMMNEPISTEELETAKSYLIGSLPLSLTSTDKIASLLLSLQLSDLPIDYLDQREKSLRSTTIEDVTRITKRVLSPNSFVTVIVGNPGTVGGSEIIETVPNAE